MQVQVQVQVEVEVEVEVVVAVAGTGSLPCCRASSLRRRQDKSLTIKAPKRT